MDARLLILAWFSTCMCLRFDQIRFGFGSTLLGSFQCSWCSSSFLGVWSVLFKFFLFCVFWCLICFFFVLFLVCFRVKPRFLVWFMIKPKFWLNLVKKLGQRVQYPVWFAMIFVKVFFLFNGVSRKKNPLSLFLVVLFQRKMDFYQTKPKKIIHFYMAKNPIFIQAFFFKI